jgi:hypothetical protein
MESNSIPMESGHYDAKIPDTVFVNTRSLKIIRLDCIIFFLAKTIPPLASKNES